MKKFLPLLFLIISLLLVPLAFASSLSVSKNADFSTDDLNFDGGQRVFVKVDSTGSGSSQRVLNVRDSQYNLLSSVGLDKSGNTYSASFSAPSDEGYYSLEAVVEGDGASSKSVKTIKVGSPGNANVHVNVSSNVAGTKTTNADQVQNDKSGEGNEAVSSPSVDPSATPEVFKSDDKLGLVDSENHNWVWSVFKSIFSFFWPFRR